MHKHLDCCLIEIDDINLISLMAKNKLSEFSYEKTVSLFYGYKCSDNLDVKIDKLLTYNDILDSAKNETIYAKSYIDDPCKPSKKVKCKVCLECDILESLFNKVKKITGESCVGLKDDFEIDDSQENLWIEKNPRCLSYEKWNKWTRLKAAQLKINVSSEIIFEKLMIELSLQTIKEELLVIGKVYNDVNNLDIHLSRKEDEQLLLELNLILEKAPHADLDMKLYRELYKNNVSFDIIREIYENNLELKISADKGSSKVMLKTSVHTYPLEEIKTDIPIEGLSLELRQKYINLISNYKNG